jgi:hypothetical protein
VSQTGAGVRLVTQLYVVAPPEELLDPAPDDPLELPLLELPLEEEPAPELLAVAASSFPSSPSSPPSLASSVVESGSFSSLASAPLLAPVDPSSPLGFVEPEELEEPPPDDEPPDDEPLEPPLELLPGLVKPSEVELPFAQAAASTDATTTVLHPLWKPLVKPFPERTGACIEAPFSQMCLFLSQGRAVQWTGGDSRTERVRGGGRSSV